MESADVQMKAGVFKEEYIAILARELLRGLEYLHGEGKLHRDIKGAGSHIDPANHSRKHSAHCQRRRQACRLWSIRSANCYNDKESWADYLRPLTSEHFRRNSVLDVT